MTRIWCSRINQQRVIAIKFDLRYRLLKLNNFHTNEVGIPLLLPDINCVRKSKCVKIQGHLKEEECVVATDD